MLTQESRGNATHFKGVGRTGEAQGVEGMDKAKAWRDSW